MFKTEARFIFVPRRDDDLDRAVWNQVASGVPIWAVWGHDCGPLLGQGLTGLGGLSL